MFRLSYFDCPFCCSTAPLSRSNEGQGFGSLGSVAELSSLSNTKEIGQESSPSSAIDISDAGIQGYMTGIALCACCASGFNMDRAKMKMAKAMPMVFLFSYLDSAYGYVKPLISLRASNRFVIFHGAWAGVANSRGGSSARFHFTVGGGDDTSAPSEEEQSPDVAVFAASADVAVIAASVGWKRLLVQSATYLSPIRRAGSVKA
eukprot:1160335-Pelagomonas_calceolata.AAC.3